MTRTIRKRAPFLLLLFFAAGTSPSALAEKPTPTAPFVCTDNLKSTAELKNMEAVRLSLGQRPASGLAYGPASDAVSTTLIEAFAGTQITPEALSLIKDVKILIENPIFDEALARTFALANAKELGTVAELQSKLGHAKLSEQLEFADLVVKNYKELLQRAFSLMDENRFGELARRWSISESDAHAILSRWAAGEISNQSEIRLAILAWTKAVSSESLLREIDITKFSLRGASLNDAEENLLTRIKQPHTDLQLAQNDGPITDSDFTWRLRYWNALGWLRHKLNLIRHPKEAAFVMGLSLIPVTAAHFFLRNWDFTNTVATVMSSVASCTVIIAQASRPAVRRRHDAVWVEVLTLRQLSEFRTWMSNHPKRAEELGFAGLEEAIGKRTLQLRKLRYEKR